MREHIKAALIGAGTIGTGVLKTLSMNAHIIKKRLGIPLEVKWVCDIDLEREREVDLSQYLTTRDFREAVEDPEVDMVVELVGGVHPAKEMVLFALERGKHVVTANKALLAEEGEEIFRKAAEMGLDLGFEASVAGGIPIIKALREGLCANEIEAIYGIINGTANYVLTRMEEEGISFRQALEMAQKKGYAEADPTLDIEGIDAAHKAAILATLCFGSTFTLSDVYVEGITRVESIDVAFARDLGYKVKLLAILKRAKDEVEIRVHPTLIPVSSSLAAVRGAYNALSVVGNAVGHTMFYGMGAGMMPTASAVVADMMDIARNILANSPARVPPLAYREGERLKPRPVEEIESKYYLRFSAIDKPGVLSRIAGILGQHNISIESVIQKGRRESGFVPIVMTTHEAKEKMMKRAVQEIDALDITGERTVLIRIENNLNRIS